MNDMTVAQLRDHLVKVRESCITLSDFVERFVEASHLTPTDVINFPLLFGSQNNSSVQIDGHELNSEQLRIYNLIIGKLQSAQVSPFYIFVSGPAGSGKSLLLKALKKTIEKYFNSDSDSCLVTAPTVIAAKNVDGATIMSTFSVSWKPEAAYINSPRKKNEIETKLKKTKIVLLDGINYVDSKVFINIEQKLRANLDSQKPFGGASLVVFGDLYQIPPVNSVPIYQDSNSNNLWNRFKLEELTKNENAVETDELKIFDILRSGGQFLTTDAIDYLKQHCKVIGESIQDVSKALEKLKTDHPGKSFAVLALSNDYVKDVNREMLKNLGEVRDFVPKNCFHKLEGPTAVYSQAANDKLTKTLSIAIGAQAMLTASIENHNHGEIGRVTELDNDYITVAFPTETKRVSRCGWYHLKEGWEQFPLVPAESFSIHKSQGMTFDGVILAGKLDARHINAVYTALSRAKSLKLCQVTHMSTIESLLKRDLEKEGEEMKRLRSCSN